MKLTVDRERFRESFERYSEIGATEDGGLHRLTLSDADRDARDALVADMEALGLDVRVDRVGNVFGRRAGSEDRPPVLVGSHLDSQPYGGRFDGQLGVLAGLETLRTLDDAGVTTEHPIELVNWTNEEGSRFQPSMLGSSVFAGEVGVEEALALEDGDGARLGDELERIGYDGDHPVGEEAVAAFLELHVEQDVTLDDADAPVGIVDGVFGLGWCRATVHGESDHAGPTAMHTRADALQAAADAVSEIGDLPRFLSADAVTTVGEFAVEPGSINVIPGRAEFTVDVRSGDDDVVERGVQRAETELAAACERHGTTYDFEEVHRTESIAFSPAVRSALDDAAERTGVDAVHLDSKAGHDAQLMAGVTDAGMVFVPSVDGVTHRESEYTEWADCVAGARVLANAVLALATDA